MVCWWPGGVCAGLPVVCWWPAGVAVGAVGAGCGRGPLPWMLWPGVVFRGCTRKRREGKEQRTAALNCGRGLLPGGRLWWTRWRRWLELVAVGVLFGLWASGAAEDGGRERRRERERYTGRTRRRFTAGSYTTGKEREAVGRRRGVAVHADGGGRRRTACGTRGAQVAVEMNRKREMRGRKRRRRAGRCRFYRMEEEEEEATGKKDRLVAVKCGGLGADGGCGGRRRPWTRWRRQRTEERTGTAAVDLVLVDGLWRDGGRERNAEGETEGRKRGGAFGKNSGLGGDSGRGRAVKAVGWSCCAGRGLHRRLRGSRERERGVVCCCGRRRKESEGRGGS